jgi:hypothetical protein
MSSTIADASIRLKANAEALKPGFDKAGKMQEKYAKDTERRLGRLGEAGARLQGTFGRLQATGDSFNRLSTDADKLRASIDHVENSVGGLANAMVLAKMSGMGMLAGIGMGIGGLVGGVVASVFSRPPDDATAAYLRRRAGRTLPSESDIGYAESSPFRDTTGLRRSVAIERRIGAVGAAAESAAERFEEAFGTRGMSAERAEIFRLERDRAGLEGMRRLPGVSDRAYRAMADDIDRAVAALRRLERAREDDETTARRTVATLADYATGRAVTGATRTPREAAMAELRSLMALRARSPDAISEDTIRRRADALSRGLGESSTGPEGLEAGSVGAARAIASEGRSRETRGEELLTEVRDAIRAESVALTAAATAAVESIRTTFGPTLDILRRALGGP